MYSYGITCCDSNNKYRSQSHYSLLILFVNPVNFYVIYKLLRLGHHIKLLKYLIIFASFFLFLLCFNHYNINDTIFTSFSVTDASFNWNYGFIKLFLLDWNNKFPTKTVTIWQSIYKTECQSSCFIIKIETLYWVSHKPVLLFRS